MACNYIFEYFFRNVRTGGFVFVLGFALYHSYIVGKTSLNSTCLLKVLIEILFFSYI